MNNQGANLSNEALQKRIVDLHTFLSMRELLDEKDIAAIATDYFFLKELLISRAGAHVAKQAKDSGSNITVKLLSDKVQQSNNASDHWRKRFEESQKEVKNLTEARDLHKKASNMWAERAKSLGWAKGGNHAGN